MQIYSIGKVRENYWELYLYSRIFVIDIFKEVSKKNAGTYKMAWNDPKKTQDLPAPTPYDKNKFGV